MEFAINPAGFHDAFAADLPETQTAVLAATQRPVAELAFSEPSGPPAWKTLPSWAVVPTPDKAAGTDVLQSMAERAGAEITELDGSHVIMISQPQAVSDVILAAVNAVSSIALIPGINVGWVALVLDASGVLTAAFVSSRVARHASPRLALPGLTANMCQACRLSRGFGEDDQERRVVSWVASRPTEAMTPFTLSAEEPGCRGEASLAQSGANRRSFKTGE